jgi:hypothetical protein
VTRSNRALNRIILLVLGLVALIVAAALALPMLPSGSVPRSVRDATSPDGLTRLAPAVTLEWIAAVVALVIIVVAVAWMATRGRGRTRVAIDGELGVDSRVADELIRDALSREPDVIASSVVAFRVRRRPVLRINVEARRGADLRRLTDAVHTAVEGLDVALGSDTAHRLPVVVQVTSGLRASLAHEHRVA